MTEEQKKDDRQHLILELEYKNGERYSMPVFVDKEGLSAFAMIGLFEKVAIVLLDSLQLFLET